MAIKNSDDFYYDVVRLNIRKFRREKGFTQQKLADESELSLDYISEIESLKRRKSFSLATLGRIADTLDIDIRYFFDNEDTTIKIIKKINFN